MRRGLSLSLENKLIPLRGGVGGPQKRPGDQMQAWLSARSKREFPPETSIVRVRHPNGCDGTRATGRPQVIPAAHTERPDSRLPPDASCPVLLLLAEAQLTAPFRSLPESTEPDCSPLTPGKRFSCL